MRRDVSIPVGVFAVYQVRQGVIGQPYKLGEED